MPRKIEISLSGKPLAEATVEEVAVADGFAEDVFAVPAGAKVLGWCDDPKLGRLKQKVTPSYPPADRLRKIQGTVSVFATVGPDGRVQDAAVAQTASPAMDNSAVKAILQWRYEPRTCDGTPVAFEEMVEVNYALR